MTKQVIEIDTLIVGATFAGIGLACQLQQTEQAGRALLIDREITVGHEFIYAFKHGSEWNGTTIQNEVTAALQSELIRRNVLSDDGRAHLPGITPVLYQYVRDQQLPIRFMTEVVSVEADNKHGGYKVTLFGGSGLREITVGKLIDTTSDCRTRPQSQAACNKRINALLHAKKDSDASAEDGAMESESGTIEYETDSYSFKRGRFDTEAYLSIPLTAEDGWAAGRRKIHHFWANRPSELQGWTLATVADQLDYEPIRGPHELDSNWLWLPSAAYANPLEAMDDGIKWAKGRVTV